MNKLIGFISRVVVFGTLLAFTAHVFVAPIEIAIVAYIIGNAHADILHYMQKPNCPTCR